MLKGGWWWKSCGRGLNGLYLNDPQDLTARQGMETQHICDNYKLHYTCSNRYSDIQIFIHQAAVHTPIITGNNYTLKSAFWSKSM